MLVAWLQLLLFRDHFPCVKINLSIVFLTIYIILQSYVLWVQLGLMAPSLHWMFCLSHSMQVDSSTVRNDLLFFNLLNSIFVYHHALRCNPLKFQKCDMFMFIMFSTWECPNGVGVLEIHYLRTPFCCFGSDIIVDSTELPYCIIIKSIHGRRKNIPALVGVE